MTLTLGKTHRPLTDFDFRADDAFEDSADLKEGFRQLYDTALYTDDMPALNRKTFHYVFVYGTLRKSYRNHATLANSELVGCGFSTLDRYFMANNRKFNYPVAFFDNQPETRGRLYGEVYKVYPTTLMSMDYLESNGLMFKRHLLSFDVADSSNVKQQVKAWAYIGCRDFWNDRIEHLTALRRSTPRNGQPPYFIYTKEYE